jgi:hypothetical protein
MLNLSRKDLFNNQGEIRKNRMINSYKISIETFIKELK